MIKKLKAILLIISLVTVLNGCSSAEPPLPDQSQTVSGSEQQNPSSFSLEAIPEFDGTSYVAINNNIPFFEESDYTTEAFELYSDLDALGRCGTAYANICIELMPTEKRGEIGSIKPSGWQTVKYDCVDGKYLYNRCHLIGFQLAGENANEKNLITGTRYMNVDGMLPFESMVADYVKETKNHVLYRVTPIFDGDNLVASGVLMEAASVEDHGESISYCVYCYNSQPGVSINYATGASQLNNAVQEGANADVTADQSSTDSSSKLDKTESSAKTYILNTSSKKFHRTDCSSVSKISASNKQSVTASREEIIDMGYEPCKSCNP